MAELLAPGPGRFLRGNLHCHSTGSDGALAPGDVVRAYRDQGYDFVAITDHFEQRWGWPVTDTRGFRTDGFTTLLGAELSTGQWADPAAAWIGAVGLPPDFAPPAAGDHAETIRRAAEARAFLWLLHPGFNNLQAATAARLPALAALHAVEVCTHASTVLRPDTAIAWSLADALLEDGRRLHAVAADDAHFRRGVDDGFGAWVEVHAAACEPDALLSALHAGTYYSTQGPALHELALDGDELRVTCGPCERIVLTGAGSRWRGGGWRLRDPDGPPLTDATFDVAPLRGSYARVTVVDDAGRRAWSNPVWV